MNDQPTKSQFLIYQADDGKTKIDVRFEAETVWLTQQLLAELFQVGVNTINYHLKEIFESGELVPEATIRNFRIVRQEGSREVARSIDFYNLDAIISVGYRVKSRVATQFRIAEGQAMRRVPMRMADWIAKLDGFFTLNDRGILTHAGKISHELALSHAEQEYDTFHRRRLAEASSQPDDFEKTVKQLPTAKSVRKRKGGKA